MLNVLEKNLAEGDGITPAESPIPPWKVKNANRAKELWALLRNSVKLSSDLVKKADLRPTTISHGVHHQRKLNHEEDILDVLYNPVTEEYVTVDCQFVRIFHKDGRRKDIIDSGGSIKKLVVCNHSNQYVSLVSEHEMKLYNSDFEMLSTTRSSHRISCMTYNESTNEVVTGGPGNISTWCFRYGNRYMIQHRVIEKDLTSSDVFEHMSLECTASHSQRCFAVCGTGVAVFNLHAAKMLNYRKDLHVRVITSILFFNPLKTIVTGSRDGSIKLWDENFGIKLVFVGHDGPITALELYPQGPYIMSASLDASIRVWSLETCDEVDLIEVDDAVLGLKTTPNVATLFSYSSCAVDLWSITHVHQVFTSIENPIHKLKAVGHPSLASRVVTQSDDAFVRLISPVDGAVLTTVVPPPIIRPIESRSETPSSRPQSRVQSSSSVARFQNRLLIDAVYCMSMELLFNVYADGSMVKASTITNPAKILQRWSHTEGDRITCLCLYEYILNPVELKEKWNDVKEGVRPHTNERLSRFGNRTLLLVGRRDGCLATVDMESGDITYKTEAHGTKGVIGIISDVRNDHIISSGKDNIVRVWRIYPNVKESLSQLMSFYCAHTPLHMTISGPKLAVAFQQLSTATYTVVMYDLKTKERSDHSPDYDHTDELTGLTCCSKLKIFASSSIDGTIRIWNDNNQLVRILKINEEALSIDFVNQKGDIVVGLNKNVHHIDHTSYLPKVYLFKMVCMEFPTIAKEDPFPLDRERINSLDEENRRKILTAKSSYMQVDYGWEPMTEEEQERFSMEEREKVGAYATYAARDAELKRLMDGSLKPKRAKIIHSERTESIAFKKYLALFYDRPKMDKIPDVDDFMADPIPPITTTPDVYEPEKSIGFFPPIKGAKPLQEILDTDETAKEKHYKSSGPDYNTKKKFIINPGGYIPNSILVKLIWPQSEVKKAAEESWKPPEFTDEQLEAMRKQQEIQASIEIDSDEDRVLNLDSEADDSWDEQLVLDYDEDDAVNPSAGAKKGKKDKKPGEGLGKKPSALMAALSKAMKTPTPPPKTPTPTPPPTPPPPPKVIKEPRRPTKPIVKYVTKPKTPPPPTPPPPTPPPPTPPPPTPPPSYMTQFDGLPWFEKHRTYIMSKMEKPFKVGIFFRAICDALGLSLDWDHRQSIADALLLLWVQEGLSESRHLISCLNSILTASVPPSLKEDSQVAFCQSALKLYSTVSGDSEELALELITQYLESDKKHKTFVRGILIELGLQDTHAYLNKELDTWEIWNLDESRPLKAQIRDMVRRWYDDWRARFKNHYERTLEQLQQGDIRANVRRPAGKTSEGKRVRLVVPMPSGGKSTKPIEVINYFCEISLEEELERVRLANIKPEPAKNTVLVLPKLDGKQALVRLGEMHTARRSRVRQELAAEFKIPAMIRPYPDLTAAFTNKLHLPSTTVYMNPFPSEADKYDDMTNMFQPILLTLRASAHQKYFVPHQSYVHM